MRSSRLLLEEEKYNVNQYVRELINNTGIISYSEAAGEPENLTYKRHKFTVFLSACTKGENEDPEITYLYRQSSSLMNQMITSGIKMGMELMPGGSKTIPLLWITDLASYEVQHEHRQTLFLTGFIRFIDIVDEKSLDILPQEIKKILKKIVRMYPYSLTTYVLAPGDFSLVRIYPTLRDLITITVGDIETPEPYTAVTISQRRAINIEDISLQLTERGEEWYTLHYSSKMVIQALEIIGTGTVERIKEGHVHLKISLPCCLGEITALGMTEPSIRTVAEKIAPALLVDPEPGSCVMDRQVSSLTDRSNVGSACSSTEAENPPKEGDKQAG